MNAVIINNNIVENIIVIDESYNGEAIRYDNNLPIGIGDSYDGTDFYRNGEKILTREEETNQRIEEYAEALRELGVEV